MKITRKQCVALWMLPLLCGTGRNKHKVYDYVDLNSDLDSLRENLNAYYRSHIQDKMFEYELVK